MSKLAKILILIGGAVLLTAICLSLYWVAISRPVKLNSNVDFNIEHGESLLSISQKAQQSGLIRSALAFRVYTDYTGKSSKFKAGHYALTGNVTLSGLADILVVGDKTGNVMKITIPEGWTTKDMDKYFTEIGKFQPGSFLSVVNSPVNNSDYTILADRPEGVGLEGYLFPDTYNIYKKATEKEVIEKMLQNLEKKFKPEWRQEIKNQGKTIYEIITMASIIEKEVRKQEDMEYVSDIFWRRIKNRQGLESCATLAYVLGVNKNQYSIEDTKTNSPYNTYRNKGLPPGPISNPGINAIKAAIYPRSNNYNFFLSAAVTGDTIYSVTFEEHVRNKNKYLK